MGEKPPTTPTENSNEAEGQKADKQARRKPDRSIEPPSYERALESYVPRGESAKPRKVVRERDEG